MRVRIAKCWLTAVMHISAYVHASWTINQMYPTERIMISCISTQLIMFNEVNDRGMEEGISRCKREFAEVQYYVSIVCLKRRRENPSPKSHINLGYANFWNFHVMPRR